MTDANGLAPALLKAAALAAAAAVDVEAAAPKRLVGVSAGGEDPKRLAEKLRPLAIGRGLTGQQGHRPENPAKTKRHNSLKKKYGSTFFLLCRFLKFVSPNEIDHYRPPHTQKRTTKICNSGCST